jgi:cytochrome c-type protein NrfB
VKWQRMATDILAVSVALIVMSVAWTAFAVQNDGPEQIALKGGNRGVVPFPHHRHQNALRDCNICHSLFPMKQGAIERLKAEGKLVKQQVMKKHCIKCHKTLKRQGSPSGPTTCAKCHIRKK